ncbi:calcium-binding protein [Planktomarina temperata]|nr:calcium-binding protein [Planktomarina temperata]
MQNVQLNNRMTYKLGVPLAQILILQGLSACGGGSSEVPDDLEPELNTINGSPNADYIRGTSDADIIFGMSGNDRILSFGGDDVINPGSGIDTVFAGDGDDKIYISALSQNIDGGDGNDSIGFLGALQSTKLVINFDEGTVQSSNLPATTSVIFTSIESLLKGSNATVEIIGASNTRSIETGQGDDFVELVGSSTAVNTFNGNDSVILYDTDVLLQLGAGTDVVEIHNSSGNFDGGTGVDTAKFFPTEIDDFEINLAAGTFGRGSEPESFGYLSAIENVTVLGSNSVKLIGDGGINALIGGSGDDYFITNGNADILTGNAGADTFEFDYQANNQGMPKISDFANNGEQDVLKFMNSEVLDQSDNILTVDTVSLSTGGIKLINANTQVLVFLSGDGFTSNAEFQGALNGGHGLSRTQSQLDEFIGLWINNTSRSANVSQIMFAEETGTYSTSKNMIELLDFSETNLAALTSDNFILV